MKFEFEKQRMSCLQCIVRECQTQEQTQELRLPEGMPDVGLIVGCWGQVILRSKEWRSESIGVSGGVMARVLYIPEGGGMPQSVEVWLPFQMKWTIPVTQYDGTIVSVPFLRSADARSLSSRKLMVRTNVGVSVQAWVPMEAEVYQPDGLPEDVKLKKVTYPLCMPKEAGEKEFSMEETLQIGTGEPQIDQLMRWSLQPEILETKLMGDKVIFRGMGIFHILYRAPDGQLHSRDFDVPLSQYAELDEEYNPDATVRVTPVVINLEAEMLPDGQLHMKASMVGQYVIWQTEPITLTEDAYSPLREVKVSTENLQIPSVLEMSQQSHPIKAEIAGDMQRCADVVFLPEQLNLGKDGDMMEAELTGSFQILYYDPDGQLYCEQCRWQSLWSRPADENTGMELILSPTGKPQVSLSDAQAQAEVLLDSVTGSLLPMQSIAELELGEQREPDPKRPSLILQRPGSMDLWELAKSTGSTVEAIKKANALEGEPEENQMLLIPIP